MNTRAAVASLVALGLTSWIGTTAVHGASPTGAETVASMPITDPCAGLSRCVSSGPFTAQVTSLIAQGGPQDRHHVLKLQLKLRNASTAPVILGYKSGSSAATDNLGNAYYYGRANTHDTSFSGIGLVTARQADPSFALRPGESRNATFTVTRFNSGGKQLGTAWAYDVVIDQLEVLPSQQIRTAAEHPLHFDDLATGMPSANAAAPDLQKAVQDLKQLFKRNP